MTEKLSSQEIYSEVAARLNRLMQLVQPRQKPLDGEMEAELPDSFWTRACITIGVLPSILQECNSFQRSLQEAGVLTGRSLITHDTDGTRVTVDTQFYWQINDIAIDSIRVGRDAPGGDIYGLIPLAAAQEQGEEFGAKVGELYEKFQIARAKELLGISS